VLPGVLSADELRGHWVSRSRHDLGFSPGPTRSLFVRRPPHLSTGFHPPSSSPPPSESCGLRAALRAWLNLATQPNGRRAPPLGSSALIAASASGVHHSAGNPDPAVTFRPRRFARPRRFPPPPAFAGLFHPAATSRVCPSGGCPSRGAAPDFSGPFMPSCRWTQPPVTSDHALAFRALLPIASAVSVEAGWASTDPRPSWASAPPGAPSAQRGNAFTSPPPMTLAVRNPSRLAFGVSASHGLACLEPGCRPARAFRPEPPSLLSKSRVRGLFQAAHRAAGHAET